MRGFKCTAFLVFFALVGCAIERPQGGTGSLTELQALSAKEAKGKRRHMSGIRRLALQEGALSLGAQSGLARQAEKIDKILREDTKYLDRVYNFQGMLLEHSILPPVLVEGHRAMSVTSTDVIRVADRAYQIKKQAHFISTVPNWREYLWMDFSLPVTPHHTLLPKNRKERIFWKKYVTQGWKQGREQADAIFVDNLARLTQDYSGMIIYRILLAQHMVSKPYVAIDKLGVTGDGKHMNINDKVLRITAKPALNTESRTWKPAINSALLHRPSAKSLAMKHNIK